MGLLNICELGSSVRLYLGSLYWDELFLVRSDGEDFG